MQLKEGVVLAGLDLRMRLVLVHAEQIWLDHARELVVTSGLEGTHSAGSLHYYGLALDFRSRYFTLSNRASVVKKLQEALGPDFRVIAEKTHIHVEYARVLRGFLFT
jgi:hypothetical protein